MSDPRHFCKFLHGGVPDTASKSCGQMAGWIKLPLGTEIGLSAGDIVLDDTCRLASASSRVLYCGHYTQYSHLVNLLQSSAKRRYVATSQWRVFWRHIHYDGRGIICG